MVPVTVVTVVGFGFQQHPSHRGNNNTRDRERERERKENYVETWQDGELPDTHCSSFHFSRYGIHVESLDFYQPDDIIATYTARLQRTIHSLMLSPCVPFSVHVTTCIHLVYIQQLNYYYYEDGETLCKYLPLYRLPFKSERTLSISMQRTYIQNDMRGFRRKLNQNCSHCHE